MEGEEARRSALQLQGVESKIVGGEARHQLGVVPYGGAGMSYPKMWAPLYFLRRFPVNCRWIGVAEAWRVLRRELTGRREVRQLRLAGLPLYVRTLTPDLQVAITTLAEGEYDAVECANPLVILDAGAHIGTSALALARHFPTSRVIALEPEEENFALLTANTMGCSRIVAVKAALWSVAGWRLLLDRQTGPVGYTIADTRVSAKPVGQTVRCVTVKTLMKELGIARIDVLKLDIEGSEKCVLENSDEWIDQVQVIIAELHERVCEGCEAAFSQATRHFARVSRVGEKVVAYRHG